MTYIIKSDAAKMRQNSFKHKDNAKKYVVCLGTLHILAEESNFEGVVTKPKHVRNLRSFLASRLGLKTTAFNQRLKDMEEMGMISRVPVDPSDPTKGVDIIISPDYFTGSIDFDLRSRIVDKNADKTRWPENRLTEDSRCPENRLTEKEAIPDKILPEKPVNTGGLREIPVGRNSDYNSTDYCTDYNVQCNSTIDEIETEDVPGEKESSLILEYTGKYGKYTWESDSDTYEQKAEMYEMIMRDNKMRRVLEQEAVSVDNISPQVYITEFFNGLAKNGLKIWPSLRGVDKLIRAHTEYMAGPFKNTPQTITNHRVEEAADRMVNIFRNNTDWHDDQGPEFWDEELSAITRIALSGRIRLDDLRVINLLVSIMGYREFNKWSQYVDGTKIFHREILKFGEKGVSQILNAFQYPENKENYDRAEWLTDLINQTDSQFKINR
jgi:hypothetical protein